MKKAHSNVLNQFENVLEKWNASPDVQACYSEAVFSYAMSIKYEVSDSKTRFYAHIVKSYLMPQKKNKFSFI